MIAYAFVTVLSLFQAILIAGVVALAMIILNFLTFFTDTPSEAHLEAMYNAAAMVTYIFYIIAIIAFCIRLRVYIIALKKEASRAKTLKDAKLLISILVIPALLMLFLHVKYVQGIKEGREMRLEFQRQKAINDEERREWVRQETINQYNR